MARVPGDAEARHLARLKFQEEVARVAVLMCEEMGYDHREYSPSLPGHRRWETYKKDAAIALAGWRAVQRYILTET